MFRVAVSGDFRRPDGTPAYPMFDLTPLTTTPGVEYAYVDPREGVMQAADLADFDALILLAARFDARSLPANNRFLAVARFGVGYDSVDVAACTKAGVALVITPDGVRRPVAVSVLTFMFALAGKLMVKDRLTREGPSGWAKRSEHMGLGLTGRTLGQLGIGNIGAEVFRVAAPLGMRFIAHDPFVTPEQARTIGVELVDIETLFRESDFLSVSVPLSEATRGIVGRRLIGMMKPTAYLINTARGPVVDQKALTEALEARAIAGAGLDVFEFEPTPADERLLKLDNVILAPHALCWTDECFAGNGAADVAAVLALSRGEEPRGVVNREVLKDSQFVARLAARRGGG
jgi:phosphoglycerate dehydrogenase-like enzyme